MKCPSCEQRNPGFNPEFIKEKKYFCRNCNYHYVLIGQNITKSVITDRKFIQKLRAVSVNDTYYFTFKQFYYFFIREFSYKKNIKFIVLSIFTFFISFLLFMASIDPVKGKLLFFSLGALSFISALGFLFIYLNSFKEWKIPFSQDEFRKILNLWESQKGSLNKMITDESLIFKKPDFDDLQDYGFDLLIITGNNEIANFLIKNDFHFRNKAAIVSYQQYPSHLFPYVIEQIQKNTDIPVFLVHNADIININMADKVRKNWFKSSQLIKIYDLGLSPEHIIKSKIFITERRENIVNTNSYNFSGYNPKEIKWFEEGYTADLNFLPPLKLIKSLEYLIHVYKEKGEAEMLKTTNSIFIIGFSALSPKLSGDKGMDFDFDMDFG